MAKANATAQIQVANDAKVDFYKECIECGMTQCKSEKEIQKIELIAQRRKLKYTNIADLFYEA